MWALACECIGKSVRVCVCVCLSVCLCLHMCVCVLGGGTVRIRTLPQSNHRTMYTTTRRHHHNHRPMIKTNVTCICLGPAVALKLGESMDIREVKVRVISDVMRKFSLRYLAHALKNNANDLQLMSKFRASNLP